MMDEAFNKQISDHHLVEIADAHCTKWRLLPPALGLENTMRDDIDCKPVDEREKQYDFLKEWKQRKGADATYKALISALQRIGCWGDAQCVFQLIHPSLADSGVTSSAGSTQTETTNGVVEVTASASNIAGK